MEDPFGGIAASALQIRKQLIIEPMLIYILDITRGSVHALNENHEVDNRNTNSHEYQGVVKPLLIKRVVPDLLQER